MLDAYATPHTVHRNGGGSYTDGVFAPTRTTTTVIGIITGVGRSKVEPAAEGDTFSPPADMWFFTRAALQCAPVDQGGGAADLVEYGGMLFRPTEEKLVQGVGVIAGWHLSHRRYTLVYHGPAPEPEDPEDPSA